MKAILLNSGIGKRMGVLTEHSPKSMIQLESGESIFTRQIRILNECGISDFIITTGPYPEMFRREADQFPRCRFTFVHNPLYDKTNYIYSMYLMREYVNSDALILHGDLVFNKMLISEVLLNSVESLCLYNPCIVLSEKDFKGRIQNGFLQEVSINIFDQDCYAFQPLYKLSYHTLRAWLEKIEEYILKGINQVYAEEALNEILSYVPILAKSYEKHYIEEVDTLEDLKRVSVDIVKYDNT